MHFLVPSERVEAIAKKLDPEKGAGLAHIITQKAGALLGHPPRRAPAKPVIDLPTGEFREQPTEKPTRTKPEKPTTQTELFSAKPTPIPPTTPGLNSAAYDKLCRA